MPASHRIIIFGNSGSGKSTLAKSVSQRLSLPHMDLDSIAWEPTQPGVRLPLGESINALNEFLDKNPDWVIEGCYASLIAPASKTATQLYFLNPGTEACQENCRNRPWEPHKYDSKQAQDANLDMLLNWVSEYATRDDEFSLAAHQELFQGFTGNKAELKCNADNSAALNSF